ncbi:MAG: YdeI/OmpD-associated family protein [Planctomycetota bacterium]
MERFEHRPDAFYPFAFDAEVEHHHVGTYRYTVVFLDHRAHDLLPLDESPRLRFSGELQDAPFDAAWQPVRGRWYVMLSKQLLKEAELSVGDTARVRFRVVDQDLVQVPVELQRALEIHDGLLARWESLSPGKRRGFAHRISSAKRAETRARRLEQVVEELMHE